MRKKTGESFFKGFSMKSKKTRKVGPEDRAWALLAEWIEEAGKQSLPAREEQEHFLKLLKLSKELTQDIRELKTEGTAKESSESSLRFRKLKKGFTSFVAELERPTYSEEDFSEDSYRELMRSLNLEVEDLDTYPIENVQENLFGLLVDYVESNPYLLEELDSLRARERQRQKAGKITGRK